jgi:hypothetical protein
MGLLGLLFGLKGWNWYMLVNRDEWYFAPINEKGEPREQFYAHFRDLVRVFNALRWPDTARCCRIGLLWYRPHFWFSQHPAKALAHGQLGEVGRASFKRRTRWTQVFTALHACDVDFELFDPGAKYVDLKDLSLLICAGFDFVDDVLPPRLFEYVRSGGNLVLFGAPPVKNMGGDSRSAFAQVLPPLESVVDWGGEVRCTCEEAVFHTSTLQVCTYDLSQYPEAVPISALAATAGYILPFGRGHFCMLGLDATRETLGFVHRRLNVPIPSQSDTDRLLTSAWRGPDGAVIVAVNVGAEDVSADVRLDLSALGLGDEQMYRVTETLAQQSRVLAGADLNMLRVAVRSRDGLIYHIQPV